MTRVPARSVPRTQIPPRPTRRRARFTEPSGQGTRGIPLLLLIASVVVLLLPSQSRADPLPDISSRDVARAYYLERYVPDSAIPDGWDGNIATGDPGTVSVEYQTATLRRINWYRAMAGLPDITALDGTKSDKCALAALMMSANNQLSHSPPSSWTHYTAEGAEAAGKSNLSLGSAGPYSIERYMYDSGSGNGAVGHRRWILYPPAKVFGSGNVVPASGYWKANVLWVIVSSGDGSAGVRPTAAFVSWPPPGYVPYQVTFPRWSFSVYGASFDSATVRVYRNGTLIAAPLETVAYGYGDPTLVWTINDGFPATHPGAGGSDVVYSVNVDNVLVGATTKSFSYDVALFNPAAESAWTPIALPNRLTPTPGPGTPLPTATPPGGQPSPTATGGPTAMPSSTPLTSTPPPDTTSTPDATEKPETGAPTLSGKVLVKVRRGRRLHYSPDATRAPSFFTMSGTLPAGVKFVSESGLITGRPRRRGRFSVVLFAHNDSGTSAPFTVRIIVR